MAELPHWRRDVDGLVQLQVAMDQIWDAATAGGAPDARVRQMYAAASNASNLLQAIRNELIHELGITWDELQARVEARV